jgi:hypothetical protein
MNLCSLLLAATLALGTTAPAVRVSRSSTDVPVAATVAVAVPQDATQDEQASYAARESAAPELGSFTGGDNEAITILAVVLIVLLVVIII